MFKMKTLPRSLAALAVAGLLPFAVLAQGKEPVKVGLVSSKSGVFAQQGEEVMRAVQFAVDEANAKGGVDGRKVEITTGDDEGTPDAGRRVAEKMARDGYNLLIGAIPSSISLAIAQNLDRWDAAYFAVASKSDKLTGDTCKPRSFRTNHSDAMDIAMINELAKGLKEKSFAILAADYVWGRDSGESFKKAAEAAGKSVPLALYAPLGTKDFSPYIAQLKAANVEAIWVAETGRDAIAFVKQAQEFGLIPAKKLIGHALIQNFMITATDKALEGTQGNTAYTPEIDSPLNKSFVAAWKAKFNRLPTDNEGQAYNGAQVMFDGVRLAKSVKPADVSKALSGAKIDTVYGTLTMRAADNQLVMPNYMGRAKVVDGVLRPVIETRFEPSLTPPPSPLCKMS
ncbi:branched-chain amino acid ABC transporter substrate-binding protein [Rhodoferax koreense]|uniref:Branched-chain amino acid ABC transporter substrate-binding protein n=1 Tax=Rhodoferax koreensis TaxID=1842727 RepID=A0A1P8JQK3_9BURK|nr:ABC transporter substrate-binding protein [Rhodoferax koreense]APW36037.1 branched-chain amino acid ABC transporter substrate-binding protein [Rhodoferax koreense]